MTAAASTARVSLDEPGTSSQPNGKSIPTHTDTDDGNEDDAGWRDLSGMSEDEVREELSRVREERDTFETQYRSLLSKLTTMRATLGDRLRQDAEELDRRETQIESLTAKVSSLESSTATLRDELVASHDETERLTKQVDTLRASLAATESDRATRSSSDAGRMERERELHELVERTKLDAHNWQSACLEERARREDLETQLSDARDAAERARQAETHHRLIAEREAASAANLSAVLSEFESSQEAELSRALGDHRAQLDTLSTSLAEYKSRAETAESKLSENADLASQAERLSAQVKEKNLLIGKLRHEAVILNEHLTEALRRLRNDQSETNVDKRLVTNLVIQFITTPRTDGKRWEMLNLIASVLDWSHDQRQQAGLSKASSTATGAQRPALRSANTNASAASVGADESFSNLFVEFLLSEAESGKDKDGSQEAEGQVPNRLLSPTRSDFATSPEPPQDAQQQQQQQQQSSGLGSYFGLSRGGNRK
ncbi:guanylate kinase [Moesziomyces antarcticus]|uniref:Guanylate kinase n=2 Tax=Pseudozyma antarctica TaxID=84753 RepID=A0A081CDJ8_PSEA2|nr:guanylate kinase [Moesziomyces antarcticus]GAK64744.1 guanylate kinase [Moesziomyces antarcticus]